jgi:hypothetical protein
VRAWRLAIVLASAIVTPTVVASAIVTTAVAVTAVAVVSVLTAALLELTAFPLHARPHNDALFRRVGRFRCPVRVFGRGKVGLRLNAHLTWLAGLRKV